MITPLALLALAAPQDIHCSEVRLPIDASTPVELFGTFDTEPAERLHLSGDLALVPGGGNFNLGYSFVTFERDPVTGAWTERGVLPTLGVSFGADLSLQGDSLLVGEPNFPVASNTVGRVLEYRWNSTTSSWSLAQAILAPGPGSVAFGTQLARDGDWLAVGEFNPSFQGQIQLFQRDPTSGVWVYDSLLDSGQGNEPLGVMAMRDDLLVVTEFGLYDNDPLLYRRGAAGDWSFETRIPIFEPGHKVQCMQLLENEIITSIVTNITFQASLISYRRDSASGAWALEQMLTSNQFVPGTNDRDFVVFAAAPETLLVGQGDFGFGAGRIARYARDAQGGWIPSKIIDRGLAATANEGFGSHLAVDGDRWLVANEDSSPHGIIWYLSLDETDRNGDGVNDVCQEVGSSYCEAVPNSTSMAGRLFGVGSPVLADGSLSLCADQLPPNEFGYLLSSSASGLVPLAGGSSGTLCLGGGPNFGRFTNQVQNSGAAGVVCVDVSLPLVPTATGSYTLAPGDTWFFQYWCRDGATSNHTTGQRIEFE